MKENERIVRECLKEHAERTKGKIYKCPFCGLEGILTTAHNCDKRPREFDVSLGGFVKARDPFYHEMLVDGFDLLETESVLAKRKRKEKREEEINERMMAGRD